MRLIRLSDAAEVGKRSNWMTARCRMSCPLSCEGQRAWWTPRMIEAVRNHDRPVLIDQPMRDGSGAGLDDCRKSEISAPRPCQSLSASRECLEG